MSDVPSVEPRRVFIVMPVYKDWEAASILCQALDKECARIPALSVHVLLVDDGSPAARPGWQTFQRRHLETIRVLVLGRNLGHQRAITAGLCFVHETLPCTAVLVMDADGEDRPEDAITLLEHALAHPDGIVFAERKRRFESPIFRAGYVLYRGLHRLLTGVSVRVGNFSVVPAAALGRLVRMSEMWNHYAGAIFKSKLPYATVPFDRGRRYRGQSHMDLASLVNHGLAGIATFHDIVATRSLIVSAVAALLSLSCLVAIAVARFTTGLAMPAWATYGIALLLILSVQLAATSLSLVFTLASNRWHQPFVPSRDYAVFVDRVEML